MQKTIAQIKTNLYAMLYLALRAYQTMVKTSTSFSPYQLVHGVELVLQVECEIHSLNLAIYILPDTSDLE